MKNRKPKLSTLAATTAVLAAVFTPLSASAQLATKPAETLSAGAGRGFMNPSRETAQAQTEEKAPAAAVAQAPEKASNLPVVAQPPKLPTVAAMPSSKTPIDTDSAINPLTGKSFSEERLTRLLNANKLVTDIARQQVAQAQLQTELELTGDRRQAEAAKIRSEVINVIPKLQVPVKDSLKAGEEFIAGPGKRTVGADMPRVLPKGSMPFSLAAFGTPQGTSGSIRIGNESIPAQSNYSGTEARVTYVDAQAVGVRTPNGASNMPTNTTLSLNPAGVNTNSNPFVPTFIPSPMQR
jgi:hypothetical protein